MQVPLQWCLLGVDGREISFFSVYLLLRQLKKLFFFPAVHLFVCYESAVWCGEPNSVYMYCYCCDEIVSLDVKIYSCQMKEMKYLVVVLLDICIYIYIFFIFF